MSVVRHPVVACERANMGLEGLRKMDLHNGVASRLGSLLSSSLSSDSSPFFTPTSPLDHCISSQSNIAMARGTFKQKRGGGRRYVDQF